MEVDNMNLNEIGKFIAQLRKETGLTQEQLGEKTGVTNKTVSRWETGTYLPPADALLIMSELFGVSVNELLSGRRLKEEEYRKAAEENLTQTIKSSSFNAKDKMEFFKKKWIKDHVAFIIFLGICAVGVLVAGLLLNNPLLCSAAFLSFVVFYARTNNSMMSYTERNVYDHNDQTS